MHIYTKSNFVKHNIDIFNDKHNILDKMKKVCCDNDCHTCSISYHKNNANVLWISIFHKGSFQFNIKYNYKTKQVYHTTNKTSTCTCVDNDIVAFINQHKKQIKYFFTKEVLPVHSAIIENDSWKMKHNILNMYLYNDINSVIKQYLCYFKRCNVCKKEISKKYDKCYDCWIRCNNI